MIFFSMELDQKTCRATHVVQCLLNTISISTPNRNQNVYLCIQTYVDRLVCVVFSDLFYTLHRAILRAFVLLCVFNFNLWLIQTHTFQKVNRSNFQDQAKTKCLFLISKPKKFFFWQSTKNTWYGMLFSNSQVWKFTRETTMIQSMFFAHSIPHHQTYIFHK